MMKFAIATLLAFGLAAIPAAAQSAAELLQKGIFAQETSGDLDSAIQIYRQIVNGAFSQREIVAQAQYRLGQTLLKKGDAAGAAEEFKKLARDFPNWQNQTTGNLIQSGGTLTHVAGPLALPPSPPQPVFSPDLQADLNSPVKVQGVVSMVVWANPRAAVFIETKAESGATVNWGFEMGSPNNMLKLGWTRNSLHVGETVTVSGFAAIKGNIQSACPGPNGAAICANAKLGLLTGITRADGTTLGGLKPTHQ
jgi:hypothetical protein